MREFTDEDRADARWNFSQLMCGVPDNEQPTSIIGFYGPRVPACDHSRHA